METTSNVDSGTAVEVPAPAGLTEAQARNLLATVGPNTLPAGEVVASRPVRAAVADVAYAGVRASSGRLARRNGGWVASGDPMDVALHGLVRRAGIDVTARERSEPATARFPFDPRRLTAATRVGSDLYVKGAPESVLARCRSAGDAATVATDMADRGLRVLAVAHRGGLGPDRDRDRDRDERDLTLVGVVGFFDPPRPDAADAVAACRRAGIRLAMVTGDHPGTARAVALALGGEPPSRRTMVSRARTGQLIDAGVLTRAFGVLGPAEVVASLGAFAAVLLAGGWTWGAEPSGALLATASGTAFAAIVLGQLANAFACRSEVRPVHRIPLWSNHLLPLAIGVELVLLVVFLAVGPVAAALGGAWPSALGWALAGLAVPAVLLADGVFKATVRRRWRHDAGGQRGMR